MTTLRDKGWTHFKLNSNILHICRKIDEGWEESKIQYKELNERKGWVLAPGRELHTVPPEGYSAINDSAWSKKSVRNLTTMTDTQKTAQSFLRYLQEMKIPFRLRDRDKSIYFSIKLPKDIIEIRFSDHAAKDILNMVDFSVDPTTGNTLNDAKNFIRSQVPQLKVARRVKAQMNISDKFPPQLISLLDKLNSFGEFYLVGGSIRDALLGRTPKDFDIMVVKPSPEELEKVLPVQKVGASFPVYLYDTKDPVLGVIEFAYARKETKTGVGYKGFSVEIIDNVKEDLARRDLTINALAWSPQKGLVMFDDASLDDLNNNKLRHVTDAFAEDPLRVLRAARFSAQLPGKWSFDEKTLGMMRSLKDELPALASDRVKIELEKSLQSPRPGEFFENLQKADCMSYWFPEVSTDAIQDLNTAAKQFNLIGLYCVLGQSMGSGISTFCKRLAIGCERDMQVWRSISSSSMDTPQNYVYVFKAGRQGKLGFENIFKLMSLFTNFDLNKVEAAVLALKQLKLQGVDPKDINTLMLKTVQDAIA